MKRFLKSPGNLTDVHSLAFDTFFYGQVQLFQSCMKRNDFQGCFLIFEQVMKLLDYIESTVNATTPLNCIHECSTTCYQSFEQMKRFACFDVSETHSN